MKPTCDHYWVPKFCRLCHGYLMSQCRDCGEIYINAYGQHLLPCAAECNHTTNQSQSQPGGEAA